MPQCAAGGRDFGREAFGSDSWKIGGGGGGNGRNWGNWAAKVVVGGRGWLFWGSWATRSTVQALASTRLGF